ncbi:MAG: SDR family NAD(P)-dependent oxidoreductase, partial [Cyanobacteria bacterium J06636_27]
MKITNRLQGKHILITGASQGLGKQLAIDFAQASSAGIAIIARDGEALKKLQQKINEISPQTQVLAI